MPWEAKDNDYSMAYTLRCTMMTFKIQGKETIVMRVSDWPENKAK